MSCQTSASQNSETELPASDDGGIHLIRRVAFVLLAALLAAGAYVSLRIYFSDYYYTRARLGAKTREDYESLLRKSLEYLPANGIAEYRLSQVLALRGRHQEAMGHLVHSMRSHQPVNAYEQMGILTEKGAKVARSEKSSEVSPETAESFYQTALRMNPGDSRILERLAQLAVNNGNTTQVQQLTSEILARDMRNLNAYYFRAELAEKNKDWRAAYTLYQKISATSAGRQESTATQRLLAEKLLILKSKVAADQP